MKKDRRATLAFMAGLAGRTASGALYLAELTTYVTFGDEGLARKVVLS